MCAVILVKRISSRLKKCFRLEKNKIQTESNKLREQLKSNQIDSNIQNSLLEKINALQKQKNDVKVKYENI